jgi:putative sugar O-methyltransferase
MSTSISDTSSYTDICEQAAKTDEVFRIFKQLPRYTDILEHVTPEEGKEYADFALVNPQILANLVKFICNDMQGSPRTHVYPFGCFSPTTLRYMKILNDLSQLKLDDISIVEIGCGYGGQYTVLRQLFKPSQYTFVDLPPVLKLIEKYVKNLELNDIPLNFVTPQILQPIEADLVISNYAFSECTKEIQDVFLKQIVNNCKHGYMIYNNMNGYSHSEFIERCSKKVKVHAERPQTHPKNVLLTW